MLVSYTGGSRFEPFYCDHNIFVTEFAAFSETFRKNSIDFYVMVWLCARLAIDFAINSCTVLYCT